MRSRSRSRAQHGAPTGLPLPAPDLWCVSPPPPGPLVPSQALWSAERVAAPSLGRTHWNRILSVALFVDHVLLWTSSNLPELRELVTESALILDKVSAPVVLSLIHI